MLVAKRKKAPRYKRPAKGAAPKWDGWEELSGEEYHRKRSSINDWYRLNEKDADLMPSVWLWMQKNEYSKEDIALAKKANSYEISSTAAIQCKNLLDGMPDLNPKEAEYWESLPGTTGTMKPVTEFVKKRIANAIEKGKLVKEEENKKEEEEKKKESLRPTIQERIREATWRMTEFIEAEHDKFITGEVPDFKHVKVTNMFRQLGVKQPHARLIKEFYQKQLDEYAEVLNPPKTDNMTELEKDYVAQLKEGYSIFDKKQIKKMYDFYVQVLGAADAMIAESKANRKRRKVSSKSPEQIVKKMKYKLSDEKMAIASIEPHKLVGANCLVVFNSKTRKLGIYYTSMEDPTGTGREGSGLTVKGTTLQRFDEKTSVACTLRKPLDQLQEVKALNTRRKFENWFEKLTTTPIKMNGRINPETVLIAVY